MEKLQKYVPIGFKIYKSSIFHLQRGFPLTVRLQHTNKMKQDPEKILKKETHIFIYLEVKRLKISECSEPERGSSAWLTTSEMKFGFQVKRRYMQYAEIILADPF